MTTPAHKPKQAQSLLGDGEFFLKLVWIFMFSESVIFLIRIKTRFQEPYQQKTPLLIVLSVSIRKLIGFCMCRSVVDLMSNLLRTAPS